jgi:hypothetical protein
MIVTIFGTPFEVTDSFKSIRPPEDLLDGVRSIFEGETGGVVVNAPGRIPAVRPANAIERLLFRIVTTRAREQGC